MNMYLHVIPPEKEGRILKNKLKKDLLCPFCKVTSTLEEPDMEWVECPIRTNNNEWICVGCCIDIASTCRSDFFEEHPYYDIVKEVAENEGRNVRDVRRICLLHQIDIINNSKLFNFNPSYLDLKLDLENKVNL